MAVQEKKDVVYTLTLYPIQSKILGRVSKS